VSQFSVGAYTAAAPQYLACKFICFLHLFLLFLRSLFWFMCFLTIVSFVDPSTDLWFWGVDRHWDQGVAQAASWRPKGMGCRAPSEVWEDPEGGGCTKGAQGRGGKEARCCLQGGGGEEARACAPSEGSDGGESRCPDEGKVASLHSVDLCFMHDQCRLVLDL
jgi:hypothetical protein